MELGKRTIDKALIKRGFPATYLNCTTLRDALQWEDREDYGTVQDVLDSVIDDCENELKAESGAHS